MKNGDETRIRDVLDEAENELADLLSFVAAKILTREYRKARELCIDCARKLRHLERFRQRYPA